MIMRSRFSIILSLFLIASCGESSLPAFDLSGSTMGTTFNITLVSPPDGTDLDSLRTLIQGRLEHVEDIASTYRDDSELSQFNSNSSTDWIAVTPEFCRMISAALDVSVMTGGAFDITVGPLVNLWGFGPSPQESGLPTEEQIAEARSGVSYEALEADCARRVVRKSLKATYVDLSGWAKGYAVDELAAMLDASDIDNYLVEIGGELRAKGQNAKQKPFSIAIEKPIENNGMEYHALQLTDVAVATSGDYRNFYERDGQRYSHTIDPRTGRPVSHQLTGVTVVSSSTAFADAFATALLVLGADEGRALAEELDIAAYFLIRTENGLKETSTTKFARLNQQ
jgi:thiamine biosynthesis lipoprotein